MNTDIDEFWQSTGDDYWPMRNSDEVTIVKMHPVLSIENFSFGGLFFQDQISFSFRLTITSFLKEFSAMKHLNSGGFSTFFAKITDFVKMISKK